MGKVIADLATSAASATFSVENATSSVDYVLSGTDGSANDHLKTDGSGNLAWVAPPAGGLTQAQQWRIDANLTIGTSYVYFYANWEKPAAAQFPGTIGSDMVVDETTSATLSGAWTFPVTGTWFVRFFWSQYGFTSTHDYHTKLYVTNDNGSNWLEGAMTTQTAYVSGRSSGTVEYIFNVADIANDKIRSAAKSSGDTSEVFSDPNYNVTGFTFLRLGDAS
jgi:hypothetical protein